MRHHWIAALSFAIMLAASPASAQGCDRSNNDYNARVAACSQVISAGRLKGPALASAYMARASAFDSLRDYQQAIADYTEAARHDPKDDNPWFYRALIYFYHMQNYQQVVADLDEAIRRKRDAPNFSLRGRAHEQLGNLPQALADFRAALKLDPKHGSALEGVDRVTKALPGARGTPSAAPAAPPPPKVAADSETDRSRCLDFKAPAADVIPACDRLIASGLLSGPDLYSAYMSRASANNNQSDYQQAIADYAEAARHDSQSDMPWFYRGMINYFSLKNYQQALADLDQAIKRKRDAPNFGLRGRIHEQLGNLEHALADFRAALKLDPQHGSALEGVDRVTKLLAARGTPSTAPVAPAVAPAAPPPPPTAAISEADRDRCQDAQAPRGEAIAACTRMIASKAMTGHELAVIHLWRGMHRSLDSDHDSALNDYNAALAIDPKLAAGYLYRAAMLEFHGHTDRALKDYRIALSLDPTMQDAADAVARIEAKSGGR